jgi:hypothetical protein
VSPALAINQTDVGAKCPACNAVIPKEALADGVSDDEVATTTPLPRVKEMDEAARAAVEASDAAVAPTRPIPVTVEACPKCGTPQKAGAAACTSCGLAVDRWPSFSAERDEKATPDARAAWERVLARWDDESRHEALFAVISARGEYSWAAGRYREQARERPGDAIAAKQMERIKRALEATLLISGTQREKAGPSPYKNLITMLGVLIVVLVVGMAYVFIKSRSSGDDAQSVSQPVPPGPPAPHAQGQVH